MTDFWIFLILMLALLPIAYLTSCLVWLVIKRK